MSSRGFTFFEAILATLLLGLTILFAISSFKIHRQRMSDIMAKETFLEVEQGVRRDLFNVVKNFYKTAATATVPCDTSTTSFTNAVYTTLAAGEGLILSPVNGDSSILASVTGTAARSQVTSVLTRCATAPNTDTTTNYFQTHAGVYWCAHLTASAGNSAYSNAMTSQQPIIAEFFFTNVDVVNGEIKCSQIPPLLALPPPQGASMGILYYTIHWVSKQTKFLQNITGMVGMGNG